MSAHAIHTISRARSEGTLVMPRLPFNEVDECPIGDAHSRRGVHLLTAMRRVQTLRQSMQHFSDAS